MKLSQTKCFYFWCLLGMILSFQVNGQSFSTRAISDLAQDARSGNQKALRDLGSLLDRPNISDSIQLILEDLTLFLPNEFDFSKKNIKTKFLDFFYENSKQLKYSRLLHAFYLTPVETQDVKYEIRQIQREEGRDPATLLRRYILRFEVFLESGNEIGVVEQAKLIAELGSEEGFQFLLEVLQNNLLFSSPLKAPNTTAETLVKLLIDFPNNITVQTILFLVEEKVITGEFAEPILAKITNFSVVQDGHYDVLTLRYNFWMDSLKTVEAMREFGYKTVFSFDKNFFEFPVDYYGKVLSQADSFPWIRHNALKDIIATQHPRTLFYIAALLYHDRHTNQLATQAQEITDLLENLTGLKIALEGKNGLNTRQDWHNDPVARLNFLKYWASHYDDYEWDDIRKSFLNKEAAVALTENYERLFRRLNSKNDSVALQSYLLLTEGDPVEVLVLARKYKELLRNHNPSLPSFKHEFLEQLVQLTAFCRRNKFRYKAPTRLVQLLQQLAQTTNEKERYRIENQIIQRLALDEVTALEYWCCLREMHPEDVFSVGRILDYFYSQHWDQILNDESQLRLYLKKTELFSKIGVVGICNAYANKFETISSDLRLRLNELLKIEGDIDIIFQTKALLSQLKTPQGGDLDNFLFQPIGWSTQKMEALPSPNSNDWLKIFRAFNLKTNLAARRNILTYLQQHPSLEQVSFLFGLLDSGVLSNEVVQSLENIYHHSFEEGKSAWLSLWEKDQQNYRKWGAQFFAEKLLIVQTTPTLKIGQLNAVTLSPYFNLEAHKIICLKALPKITPLRHVQRLRTGSLLSLETDLAFFDVLPLTYKELDDIPKLFDLEKDMALMIEWLMRKAKRFDEEQQAAFYNNIFQKNWFGDYINSGSLADTLATHIQAVLTNYLQESAFISAFEEQTTIRNIALLEMLNKTLKEKIEIAIQLNTDVGSKIKLQQAILSRVSYEDLPVVAPYFVDLQVLKQSNFLNRDFGLPIFNLQDYEVQTALIKNHKSLTEFELYKYYLLEFGVDFLTKKGDLDFNKIYNILEFDIVMPFVGVGGNKRDYFTYGIIKLLELHFNNRLGFHEKLNENQTFYTFTASKRAKAWLQFLEERGLVQPPKSGTPSFNMTMQE